MSTVRASFVPNAEQSAEVDKSVFAHEDMLDGIDKRLVELEREKRWLVAQRNTVSRSQPMHQTLLAPIRRLMPDVLGRVFELSIDDPTPAPIDPSVLSVASDCIGIASLVESIGYLAWLG